MNTAKRFARKNTFDRPRFDSRYGLRAVASVALGMVMLPLGFTEQKYPERLVTRRDVLRAKPDADQIDIRLLPLQDYPLLSKFSQVKQIFYYNEGEKGATDAKLKALASLNLTNVVFISLLGCRLVTDEGIRVLAGIRSLKSLQLEGTAITDAACHIMLTNMHLSGVNSGVNVANCRGVTIKGITALANSDLMEGLDFSTDNLSED